jgi:four helix bundle protein
MSNFKNLRVWLRAKELAKTIYLLSNEGGFCKDFGFRDQVRRSVVSIASNISEGDESGTNKMAVKYFYVAKGSAAELYTQISIAEDIGYIDSKVAKELIDNCEAISAMLHKLIKSRCE